MPGHWLHTFRKCRAMTASARHFLQRGFIPVSEQVAHYEDEKTARIGLVGCFGWDVAQRETERSCCGASSGTGGRSGVAGAKLPTAARRGCVSLRRNERAQNKVGARPLGDAPGVERDVGSGSKIRQKKFAVRRECDAPRLTSQSFSRRNPLKFA